MSLLKPKGLHWSTIARLLTRSAAGICREGPLWRSAITGRERNGTESVPYKGDRNGTEGGPDRESNAEIPVCPPSPWPRIPACGCGGRGERNGTESVPYRAERNGAVHVFICVADHFEPKWERPRREIERRRVEQWLQEYPAAVAGLFDSAGRSPQHTFFYPAEEYEPEYLDRLAELCQAGFGDVEVHLHHDNDTSANLRETLLRFTETLHQRHGLLAKDETGRISYGFIHGNWALDNSRRDGRWCGVDDELSVLMQTGCYADFTMPSAPADCQTRTINSIYYAVDDACRPCSHDCGTPARVGQPPPNDSLLMIQGPLALDWRRRKWGLVPRIENGDLHGGRPPDLERLRLWLNAGVSVAGRPDWRFVKLHTHGAQERNAAMLLRDPMRRFHESLAELARRWPELRYYYVTAREMAELVHQAEAGAEQPSLAMVRTGAVC